MKKLILILILFAVLLSIVTYPLVFSFSTAIPGFYSTDETYGVLWDFWRMPYSFRNHICIKQTPFVAYPFRANLYSSGYISFLWIVINFLLSFFTTPVIAYNLQVFLNLLLSGVVSCFLVYYLTGSILTGIFSGIIFAFCPYQLARIWQHLGLTYNEFIPLILLMAILLKEEGSRKKTFFLFLSFLLVLSFDFSVMYFTAMVILAFIAYIFFYSCRINAFKQRELFYADLKYLKKIIITGLLAFIVLFPQFYSIFRNMFGCVHTSLSGTPASSAWNFYQRPFEDLFVQSARPLSYILPASSHPLFGGFTEQFIGSQLYGESLTEHTLYLGWVPMILALVAFRRWRKTKKTYGLSKIGTVPCGDSPYFKDNFYIGFFIFLAAVAWLFSQPPWWNWFGFKVYMPSFFMYKILPMFRAYCRFGIVLMLAVAVLAGFGLKFILERFNSNKTKIIVTILACGLVLFEFWSWPPYKVIDVSKIPAVYYWLEAQPADTIIAEYPLDTKGPNEMYKFFQTTHEKKIINGTMPRTYANRVAQTITKLSEPKTAGVLKWMGVRYVLVHRQDYQKTDLVSEIEELGMISKNPGLKFVRSFPAQDCPREDTMCVQKTGPIDIYEVIASPFEPAGWNRND